MAAPTPVSAYLHAAAMVKAGVYLVALLAPAFADVPGWRPVCSSLGAGHDAARRLAGAAPARPQAAARLRHGQPARLPDGHRAASAPGPRRWPALAMLVAHALFKATLFLVVGIVDHAPAPATCASSPGSAGGCPVVGGDRRASPARRWPACRRCRASSPRRRLRCADRRRAARRRDRARAVAGWIVLVGGVVARLGADRRLHACASSGARSRPSPACPQPTSDRTRRPGSLAAPVLLAAASRLVVGFLGGPLTTCSAPYADRSPPIGHARPTLALWHGLAPALALSVVSLWPRRCCCSGAGG